jgi:hypothetical protein
MKACQAVDDMLVGAVFGKAGETHGGCYIILLTEAVNDPLLRAVACQAVDDMLVGAVFGEAGEALCIAVDACLQCRCYVYT